jgi:hypothetical protein
VAVYCLDNREDAVYVSQFNDGGGLVSFYKETKNLYVHTLNTETGLQRKLECLGIPSTSRKV